MSYDIKGKYNEAPSVDVAKTTPLTCECGNHTFSHVVLLREISAIVSPTGQAAVTPIPTFACNACGVVPDKLIPSFIKEEFAKKTTQNNTSAISRGGLSLMD